MENTYPNSPTRPRHYATYTPLKPSREDNRNAHETDKDNAKGRKKSILTILGKLSKSKSSSRSQSPFSSPRPYSSPSTPPQQGSTTAPRLSNPHSPPTSTSLVSINLKPAEYVRRIKRLLAHSRKAPPSPLSTPSHPASPIHVDSRNDMQKISNGNATNASADNELQRQGQIHTAHLINTPTVSPQNNRDKNHVNNNDHHDYNNYVTGNNEDPGQNQTRTASPLLPPTLQPSLLLNPSTSKESRFLKTFLRSSPPRSNAPLTQFNIATLQAELDGRPGAVGRGVRDVSKPNPLGADGGDDYDELLELGRSARAAGREEEERDRSREKLVCGVERWLDGVQDDGGNGGLVSTTCSTT